ncbi:MAG: dihydroorotase [Calditrichaeota bacterium]|nr:dihydroorotase [Calditrichota bacterium]
MSRKAYQAVPEQLLLKNGRIIDPQRQVDEQADILIENGVITRVGIIDDSTFPGQVIDLTGKIVSPGWMDMHTHLREPGREDEETIESGMLAAANGGFTSVCCMPNTQPPIDTQEIIQYIKDRSRNALVNVHPIAAITKGREGKELSEILELVEQGAVAISDDGSPVMSAEIMRRALEYSRMVDIPVIGHEEDITMTEGGDINEGYTSTCLGLGGMPTVAEDIMVARDIMLAEYTGARFHVAHVSSGKSVELIRQAKAKGIKVTAEVTPHHFSLTEEAVRSFDTNTKMNPPLRTEEDRQALLEGLKDGTIDVIATDHAPHSWEEKEAEYKRAPFGIIGLETALGVSLTYLYHTGILSLPQIIEKFAVHPYRILNLPQPAIEQNVPANLTIFDPEAEWVVQEEKFLSKSTNSPFIGHRLKGKPFLVIHNGQLFFSTL